MWFKSNSEEDWENSPIMISSYRVTDLAKEITRLREREFLKFELEKHFYELLRNTTDE